MLTFSAYLNKSNSRGSIRKHFDFDVMLIAQLWLNLLSSGSDSQTQRHTRSTIVTVCSASYHIAFISVCCAAHTHTLTITLVIACYWASCLHWDQKSVAVIARIKEPVGVKDPLCRIWGIFSLVYYHLKIRIVVLLCQYKPFISTYGSSPTESTMLFLQ